MRFLSAICISVLLAGALRAQDATVEKWSWHYQFTGIMQGHAPFHAPYAGQNSLDSVSEQAFSVTSTFFLGRKLWRGGSFYVNPEIAGGKGISSALGIAGFTNGECFRIGDPSPAVYLARVFYRQYFGTGGTPATRVSDTTEAGANQLGGELIPKKGFILTAGKFSIADVFDASSFSHDPRTQFMNWSLMSNGAWDYPANTRGYTWGFILEYRLPGWAARISGTMVPKVANGSVFDTNIAKAHGESLELEHGWGDEGKNTIIRVLAFRNLSRARSYRDAIDQYVAGTDSSLDVNTQTKYGGMKYGVGINIEQHLMEDHIGLFARAGWNDGHTATWVFTEIDNNVQFGGQMDGWLWKRKNDVVGIAASVNGISKDHRDFLNIGGYGFIIGDGKLPHYGPEMIGEAYYSAQLTDNLWLSADYQFVKNPAYNADRGPVSVWAVRGHVAF